MRRIWQKSVPVIPIGSNRTYKSPGFLVILQSRPAHIAEGQDFPYHEDQTRHSNDIAALLAAFSASAQIIPVEDQKKFVDSLRNEFDNGPYFGLYKDNYFTVGTTLLPHQPPSKTNSDVKFQISIAQRLTKSKLPWNTFLFLMYTQKTFWNVFEESPPMRDMNFNPGIGISKPFFNKDRYIGKLTMLP